jgi:AraC-like DNA-binding protein
MGLRQPTIFTQQDQAAPEKPKYERSALDDESSKMLLQELKNLMATERPYLDSRLTLAQLAEQLRISSNYLSQIINQQTGSNFFDYINSHRVEAAKEILADPARARVGVLTIAMDSGFNSKSAFYTAFKHHANMTPSQYRQSKLS